MNYFAHAYPSLLVGTPDPYYLAGLAVPDWLSVVARRTKCHTKHVEPFLESYDKPQEALAKGIAQHHSDDLWFHNTRAFAELSLDFAVRIRNALKDERDLRAGFLGHILVELLLDAELISEDRTLLDEYYRTVGKVDAKRVADEVAQMSGKSVGALAELIPKFVEIRFLADYAVDALLCFRVNQVLSRVGLPALPGEFDNLLPGFRTAVGENSTALMLAPASLVRAD